MIIIRVRTNETLFLKDAFCYQNGYFHLNNTRKYYISNIKYIENDIDEILFHIYEYNNQELISFTSCDENSRFHNPIGIAWASSGKEFQYANSSFTYDIKDVEINCFRAEIRENLDSLIFGTKKTVEIQLDAFLKRNSDADSLERQTNEEFCRYLTDRFGYGTM